MKILSFILIVTLSFLCKSPAELMEKGKYNKAFKRAIRQIKKKENIDENITVLKQSARIKADKMLRYSHLEASSRNVEDWVNTQGYRVHWKVH